MVVLHALAARGGGNAAQCKGMPESISRIALCFRDHPMTLDEAPKAHTLAQLVEMRCRRAGVTCMVDTLSLHPARKLRSLLRPIPRSQELVTTIWRDAISVEAVLGKGSDGLWDQVAAMPHVMFAVPGSYVPGIDAVESRLSRKELIGGCGMLGDLQHPVEAFPEPPDFLGHPALAEIQRQEQRLYDSPQLGGLQYDRRVFCSAANTANGDVQPGLEFQYFEASGVVWAFYEGGGVELGTLVARKDPHGRLRMVYQHLSNTDQLREGQCFSYPEILPDGHLRMREYWRWTCGDHSYGESVLDERRGVTIERKIS